MSCNGEDFKLSSCQWIGFDLDNTVARYNVPALEELEFRAFLKYFITHLNYPSELEEIIKFDQNLCFRGVIIDLLRGNMLKIDSDKIVVKGYHGSREIENQELKTIYSEPLEFDGSHTDEYWSISTFFEAGVAPLWIGLIDYLDKNSSEKVEYMKIHQDIKKGIEYNFYKYGEGYFFPDIMKNPEKFLFKRDDLVEWFKGIIQSKTYPIKLFLLTNSDTDFAKLIADYCLGPNWEDLFELVLYFGRKPSFWNGEPTSKFQLVSLDENEQGHHQLNILTETSIDVDKGKLYRLGNGKELHVCLIFLLIHEILSCSIF